VQAGLLLVALLTTSSLAHAQTVVGAEAAAATRYVYRGFALTESPVVTPSTWAIVGDVTVTGTSVLATSARDGDALREVDLEGQVSRTLGPVRLEPGLAAYLVPAGGSTAEAIVTLALEGEVLELHTSHVVDLVAMPGAYYAEVGLSVGGALGETVSLKGSVDAGAGTARFHSFNAGVRVTAVTVVRTSLELYWQATDAAYVSGKLELDSLVAGPVRRAVDDPELVHAAVAVGFER
jgi:hypothetical protein